MSKKKIEFSCTARKIRIFFGTVFHNMYKEIIYVLTHAYKKKKHSQV